MTKDAVQRRPSAVYRLQERCGLRTGPAVTSQQQDVRHALVAALGAVGAIEKALGQLSRWDVAQSFAKKLRERMEQIAEDALAYADERSAAER